MGRALVCPDGSEAPIDPDLDSRVLRRALIVSLYARGVSVGSLAEIFGTSRWTINREIRRLDPRVASRVAKTF